ncbi:MAG: hypothetical protein KKF54_03305 [Candidatus Omnitrophica bacterium]|nr:hypothetical protein [Candidatus Omnitrophota bacterium]
MKREMREEGRRMRKQRVGNNKNNNIVEKRGRYGSMSRMFKLFVLVGLVCSFGIRVDAETLSGADKNTAFRMIGAYIETGGILRALNDLNTNSLNSIQLKDSRGDVSLTVNNKGEYITSPGGKTLFTFIWDAESGAMYKIATIIYEGNKPIYSVSFTMNEDGSIEMNNVWTLFDEFGQPTFRIALSDNTPNDYKIVKWVNDLFIKAGPDAINLEFIDGQFCLTGSNEQKIIVDIKDVRKQALGLVSIEYLIESIIASEDLVEIGNLREAIKAMHADENMIIDAINAVTPNTVSDGGLDAYLNNLAGAEQFIAVVNAIMDYRYDDPAYPDSTMKLGLLANDSDTDAEGTSINRARAIIKNKLNDVDAFFKDAESVNELVDRLASADREILEQNIITNVAVVDADGNKTPIYYQLYTLFDASTAGDNYADYSVILERLHVWGARSGQLNAVKLTDFQIRSLRQRYFAGGVDTIIYLDENGDVIDPNTYHHEYLSIEDTAVAMIEIIDYVPTNLDLLLGRLDQRLEELFGVNGLLAGSLISDGTYQYMVIGLGGDIETIADINIEEIELDVATGEVIGKYKGYLKVYKKKVMVEVGDETSASRYEWMLNPNLTEEDLDNAKAVYADTLCSLAPEVGLSLSRERTTHIMFGKTNAAENNTLESVIYGNLEFTDENIDAIINYIADKKDYHTSYCLDASTRSKLKSMSMEDKRELVDFLFNLVNGNPEGVVLNRSDTRFFGEDGERICMNFLEENGEIRLWIGEETVDTNGVKSTQYNNDNVIAYDASIVKADFLRLRDSAAAEITYDQTFLNNLAKVNVYISGVSMQGTLKNVNLVGEDFTKELPKENQILSINLDQLAMAIQDGGDPAYTSYVLGVTDEQGVALTSSNLEQYKDPANGLDRIRVDAAVWYWTDIENVVHVDQYWWNNLITQDQRNAFDAEIANCNANLAAGEKPAVKQFYNEEENPEAVLVSKITVDFRYVEGYERAEAVTQIQNTLTDPAANPLTCYGLQSEAREGDASGVGVYVYMLGFNSGDFQAHVGWQDLLM